MAPASVDGATPERRRDQFYRWLLLTGDRTVIVGSLAAATFLVTLGVVGGYLPADRVPAVPVLRLSTALTGGLLPFVTLVLTINQLALSMELGSVFHLDRRLDSMREFRERIADVTGCGTCPAEPAPLLALLFDATHEKASTLADCDVEAVADFGEGLAAEVDDVYDRFGPDSTMFDALVATRRYNPGAHLHDLEQSRRDASADRYTDVFDDLEAVQKHLDVAQKYFWTVYTEDEMATLSRLVLYTGVVALLTGVALALGVDHLLEAGVRGWRLTFVVALAITLETLPFSILFAYMLRVATVARTSAGFGPFVTEGPGWD